MARYSSKTGAVAAALLLIVCVHRPAPAQEWVRWRSVPSLRDQDPAKRLPAAQPVQATAPEPVAAPVAAEPPRAAPVATAAPVPAKPADEVPARVGPQPDTSGRAVVAMAVAGYDAADPIAVRELDVAAAASAPRLAAVTGPAPTPHRGGAYVTVGSDSDASLVAAAPQVYACDDDGRCEQLQDEHAGVGLDAPAQAQASPQQQIESQIKRNALRSF
ncbi:hypothetical protein [Lysobacter silvisoli]|uniref:Uncharacterized protein n=1 Tax=Lysobacter silvisoli TaxID=2293254 RepID=A0A371K400_9GAMM|nr:hypothetical protein [Lysobacter silvisoli]RDZ28592.1 hypothetical protein DX914_05560 [Lysobacter silvisoli]